MHLFGLGTVPQILDSGTANSIALAIQQQEGYNPGSLAYQNNNPGNLIYAGQAGAVPGAGGFAAFPNYSAGFQALLNQLQLYASRGYTIQQMMNVYLGSGNPNVTAPASQGDSVAYAQTVANAVGASPDTSLIDLGPTPAITADSSVSLDPASSGFSAGSLAMVGIAAVATFLLLSRS